MKSYIMIKMSNITNSIKSGFKSYARLFSSVAFFCAIAQNSLAFDSSKYQEDLQAVENYLNNITNLSADFVQNSEGSMVEGKFYLARNKETSGKMRVEYSASPKVLIIVNGAVLSYYDVELDEISHLRTNTTPASLLTRPNISFSAKDVEVTGVKKTENQIKISLMKKNRKEAGEFSLIFKTNPIEFAKMEVKNDLNQTVLVTLSNINFEKKLPNSLFIIKQNSQ
jgi:outer membrane lipoprotein-sorting protein